MKAILILPFLLLLHSVRTEAQVAVIVNKSVTANAVEAAKLADIYKLTTKKWEDGNKIVVFDLKADDAVREAFYKFIHQDVIELRKAWMRLQLTGEGKAPAALKTEDEIVQQVASTPGAIGYVSAAKVTDAVKVVARID